MSLLVVINETRETLDELRNNIMDCEDKWIVVRSMQRYVAFHPVNPSTPRIADADENMALVDLKAKVEGYYQVRINAPDLDVPESFERNEWACDEDEYSLKLLAESSDIDTARRRAAKHLALTQPNADKVWLRTAITEYDAETIIGMIRTYVKKRYIQLDGERRSRMLMMDSITYEEMLNEHSRLFFTLTKPTLDELESLKRRVERADTSVMKVRMIREYIANRQIDDCFREVFGMSEWEYPGTIVQRVDNMIQKFKNGCGFIEHTAETLGYVESLEGVIDGDFTDEKVAEVALNYLITIHTDASTFWLRAAMLVPCNKMKPFLAMYIGQHKDLFLDIAEENERRNAMANENNAESIQQDKDAMDRIDRHHMAVENGETCPYCGCTYDDVSDVWELDDGTLVCEDCYNHLRKCDECGEYHYQYDMTEINGDWYCQDCVNEHWVTCHACNEWLRRDDCETYYSEIESEWYCESCYEDRFTHCLDCDCEIYRDDSYYSDDDYEDGPYCSDCYYENHDYSDVIYDYHEYDGGWDTLFAPNESCDESKFKLGIEIEVGGQKCYAKGLQEILGDRAILAKDSTVNGFEIITMPMTRQYFEDCFKDIIQEGFKYLEYNGFRGHNEGGIHIHFTTIKNRAQLLRMIKILYTQDSTITNLWKEITQRSCMDWCRLDNRYWTDQDILEGKSMVASREPDNHHTALNYDPDTETHELRIFNSTLRLDRFLKNAQVLFSLLDYTSMGGRNLRVDVYSWLDFVKAHKTDYPELDAFLVEKNLYNYKLSIDEDLYDLDTEPVLTAQYQPQQLSLDFDTSEYDNFFIEDDDDLIYFPDITQDEVDAFAQSIEEALVS